MVQCATGSYARNRDCSMYQLNRKWILSANWILYTGDAVTYPSGNIQLMAKFIFIIVRGMDIECQLITGLTLGHSTIKEKKEIFF